MFGSPTAENIGLGLMIVGFLCVIGGFVFAKGIARVRVVGFGAILNAVNGVRIGLKLHDNQLVGIAVLIVLFAVCVMVVAPTLVSRPPK